MVTIIALVDTMQHLDGSEGIIAMVIAPMLAPWKIVSNACPTENVS